MIFNRPETIVESLNGSMFAKRAAPFDEKVLTKGFSDDNCGLWLNKIFYSKSSFGRQLSAFLDSNNLICWFQLLANI
jgi:hypothetical protein